MKHSNFFNLGFREMFPITTGIIPFGAVMGTICSEAKLGFLQTFGMNIFVFAGAAQLAAVELMNQHALVVVVIATGLIINLRFLLYSAALSPIVHRSGFLVKLASSYLLTDQSYAVMSANHKKFSSDSDAVQFYFGAALCMALIWHASVICGFVFGNFAPASWALEYAVPISFLALLIPTLKNRNYVIVAAFSTVVSILLNTLPYRSGLIVTSVLAIGLAALLTKRKASL